MAMFVSKGLKHGTFNQFHLNGNLQTQSNFIKGEIWKVYFISSNGNEQIVTFYNYNNRDGSYEEFHENGRLKICGNYYKGKRIGEFLNFSKVEVLRFITIKVFLHHSFLDVKRIYK